MLVGPIPRQQDERNFRKNLITETETLGILSNPQLDDGGSGTPAHMTPNSQSREDVVRPMTFLLHPRQTTKFGTWNINTMYQAGRTAQIAAEMRRYKLHVLGISEVRWLSAGQLTLDTGEELLYSGKPDGSTHEEGVGLLISKESKYSLLEWDAVSSRIITARFKSSARNITVINAYAPTNLATPEVKDEFYEQLQSVLNKIPRRDIKVLLGDLNAKVGNDNAGREDIMGKHGLGVQNDNGERFVELCTLNDLVIGGTLFPHKDHHKATWISHDRRTENQIDHITISKKFRGSMLDVRVKRGADAASDHNLLVCNLRLKLQAAKKFEERSSKRYNVSSLKDRNKLETFKLELRNRFSALSEDTDLETQWKEVKEMYTGTCDEVLGKAEHRRKPWMTDSTWEKIDARKLKKQKKNEATTTAEKEEANMEYEEANREVKRSTRRDKSTYVEDLAAEAQKAARSGDMAKVYSIAKQLSGKKGSSDVPVKNKEGTRITTDEGQRRRWSEHFKEILNRPPPTERANFPTAEDTLPIKTTMPTKEEIKAALKSLKSRKAPGPDGIPPEAFTADTDTATSVLHKLYVKIWEEEEIPEDWKMGHIVKLPKKGDLSNCGNWRGITLLSIASKVLLRVILDRMKTHLHKLLRQNQAGFTPGKSTTDQAAALRIIIEQVEEWNSTVYMNFIDFLKAFDSLDRESMFKLLEHYGVPEKIIKMIKCIYKDFKCKVIHKGKLSPPFPVKTGVRQGCLLSPLMFILAIDWIMKHTESKNSGLQWTLTKELHDLDFADDIVLFSRTLGHIQQKTTKLEEEAAKLGLIINSDKTKSMRINARNPDPVTVSGAQVEDVEKFTYLGCIVTRTGGTEEDVEARIRKARNSYHDLRKIWNSRQISIKLKLTLYNSIVKSVLLYGSETWRMTDAIRRKLQTFTNRCLRRIMGVFWPLWVTNEELWRITDQKPIDWEIRARKWRWIGHTLRKDPQNITRQSLQWNPAGRRSRGRPKQTWRRTVEGEMKCVGLSWGTMATTAENRVRWKSTVSAICANMHK